MATTGDRKKIFWTSLRGGTTIGCITFSIPVLICWICVSLAVLFPGAVLTGIGFSARCQWEDDFSNFRQNCRHNHLMIIGPVLVAIGIVMLITGVILGCYMVRRVEKEADKAAAEAVQLSRPNTAVSHYPSHSNGDGFGSGDRQLYATNGRSQMI